MTSADQAGQTQLQMKVIAAAGATVVQVGGDLYVSDETLSALWEPVATTPGECPYPGLEAFGPAQAKWFFGREMLTGDLIDLLDRVLRAGHGGPIAVVGPSGAGKSSLLGAGLLAALRNGRLAAAGSADWPVVTLTPGATPVPTLIASLQQCAAAVSGVSLDSAAETSPKLAVAGLRDAIAQRDGTSPAEIRQRVVVVVDQLEELFTAGCEEPELTEFLSTLAELAAPGPGGPAGVVVLGLRADFYSLAADYPMLRTALQSVQLVVGAMSTAEVTAAITRPARAAGLRLDGELAERLLHDLGAGTDGTGYEAGRLPLLGYALRATWQRRSGDRLTIADYEQTGRIGGAIAKAAEDIYCALGSAQQRLALQLLLGLVHVGSDEAGGEGIRDTRRRVSRKRLVASVADPEGAAGVLAAFTAARLLTSGGQTVEITHDALLSSWPRLRGWISQDRSGSLIRQSLEDAAADWDRDARDPGSLYGGIRLAAAHEWAEDPGRPCDLSPVARDFLAASHRRRRGALRRRNAIIAVLAALSIGLAVLAGYARRQQSVTDALNQQESGAIFEAQAQAAQDQGYPDTALKLAAQADRLDPAWNATKEFLLASQSDGFLGRLVTSASVLGEAYNPAGTLLATESQDRTLRLWNPRTHRQVGEVRLRGGTGGGIVAFSPAHSPFAPFLAADEGNGVHLWRVYGSKLTPVTGYYSAADGPGAFAFSPDGRLLAVGDDAGHVRLWDLATGRVTATLRAAPSAVASTTPGKRPPLQAEVLGVAFSPDGRRLITATNGGTVRIWDTARTRLLRTLPADDVGGVLAVSPTGRVIAVSNRASGGVYLQLWPISGGTHAVTVPGTQDGVSALAFSPDGTVLAAGYDTGYVGLWSVAGRSPTLQEYFNGHSDAVEGLAFGSHGKTLASADPDHSVTLWDVGTNTVNGYADPGYALAFSPARAMLGVGSADGGKVGVTLYSVPGRRKIAALVSAVPRAKSVTAVAFSPDGRTLAVATSDPDATVQLWNVAGRRVDATIPTHQAGYVYGMAFRPHGGQLATSGGSDPVIRLWNPTTGEPSGTLSGNVGVRGGPDTAPGVYSLAYSPNGSELAAAGVDGVVRLWHALAGGASPTVLSAPDPSLESATAVTFSGNDADLAAGYRDGSVVVWAARCLHCAPQVLRGSDRPIAGVAFTTDGRTLVDADENGNAQLWPTGTWTTPTTFLVSGQSLAAMALSPHGGMMATGDGYAVRLWSINPADVAESICQTFPTPVSRADWTKFGLTEFPYTPVC